MLQLDVPGVILRNFYPILKPPCRKDGPETVSLGLVFVVPERISQVLVSRNQVASISGSTVFFGSDRIKTRTTHFGLCSLDKSGTFEVEDGKVYGI